MNKIEEVIKRFEEQRTEQKKTGIPEEFMVYFANANIENFDILKEYKVTLEKYTEAKVLNIAPDVLKNRLQSYSWQNKEEIGKNHEQYPEIMGYIRKHPDGLCIPKEKIFERMNICMTLGKQWTDSVSSIANSFIFNAKEFQTEIYNKLTPEERKVIETPKEEIDEENVQPIQVPQEQKTDDDCIAVINEIANLYALSKDQKQKVINKLNEVANSDLSNKEKILQAFSVLPGGNSEILKQDVEALVGGRAR